MTEFLLEHPELIELDGFLRESEAGAEFSAQSLPAVTVTGEGMATGMITNEDLLAAMRRRITEGDREAVRVTPVAIEYEPDPSTTLKIYDSPQRDSYGEYTATLRVLKTVNETTMVGTVCQVYTDGRVGLRDTATGPSSRQNVWLDGPARNVLHDAITNL